MSSPSTLEFESLVAPIAGDDPAGSTVPFQIREKLEEARKEIDPDQFDADDPSRPEQPKKADWITVIELGQQTLRETSKDLLVTARLTEALTKRHGFAGLRDGLRLFRMLVADAWDRLHPVVEDGDVEVRAASFNWLDDNDRGARFPYTIRQATMFVKGDEKFGWAHWRQVQDGKGPTTREQLDGAIAAMTYEAAQLLVEDLTECLSELNQIKSILNEKMGRESPSLGSFGPAIGECYTLAQQVLSKKAPTPAAAEEGAEGGVDENGQPSSGRRRVSSREEAYRQLVLAAETLQQIEPHSPVPYFIFRAVELGALPFPQLMKRLIRENAVLDELNRELGIADENAGQS